MRGLAEFVMKGRQQAIMAVILTGLIPLVNFLNPVIVGLIVLRKGLQDGVFILLWALLPLVGWMLIGDVIPLIMLFGVTGLALILRETESWTYTLLAAVLIGIVVESYLRLQPQIMDVLMQQMEQVIAQSNIEGVEVEDFRAIVISFIGAVYMMLAVLLTMLARWMQAALYNPGGFQQEFHGFRIDQRVALLLVVLVLLANLNIVIPVGWAIYMVLPLVFAGLALVHGVVAGKQLPRLWLVTFYVLLALPMVVQLLVMLALVDSWYDFRRRLKSS